MILKKIQIKNFGPHSDTEIEFNEPITAIIGHNGAGKTFVLEAIPAILFGDFPSRSGSILDHITQGHYGDASLSCEFLIGDDCYRAERKAKKTAKTQSQECFLFHFDGGNWVAKAGPKQDDFKREINRLVGDEKLFFSSVFSSQTMAGDLIDAKPAERKKVLADLLGLDKFQIRSEKFSERARAIKYTLEEFDSRKSILTQQLDDEASLLSNIELAESSLDRLSTEKRVQSEMLSLNSQEIAKLETQFSEIEKIANRKSSLEERSKAILLEMADINLKLDAIDRLKAVLPDIQKHQAERDLALKQKEEQTFLIEKNHVLKTQGLELNSKIDSLKNQIKTLEVKKASSTQLAELQHQQKIKDSSLAIANANKELESLKTDTRILEVGDFTPEHCKSCMFTAKAFSSAKKIEELNKKIELMTSEFETLKASSFLAPNSSEFDSNIATFEAEIKSLEAHVVELRAQWVQIPEIVVPIDRSAELADSIAKINSTGEWLVLLEQKKSLLGEIDLEISNMPPVCDREAISIALHTKREAGLKLEMGLQVQDRSISQYLELLGGLRQKIAKNAEILAAIKQLELDNVEHFKSYRAYEYLRDAFGRNGIQALLIDSAIPGIQSISDELLQIATDGRFRIEISTEKERKSGGTAESLEILCSDHAGTRDIQNFSGGEQKILRTVLRMALSIFQANRTDIRVRTLFIDELFDALDQQNATALLQTLHRVSDYFDRVVFISHSDEILSEFGSKVELLKSSSGTQVRS